VKNEDTMVVGIILVVDVGHLCTVSCHFRDAVTYWPEVAQFS